MKNKTCGECRKHDIDCFIAKQAKACEYFEPKIKTNGDRIRSMSDEELAKKFVHKVSMKYVTGYVETYWVSGILRNKKWLKKEFAIEATIEELKKEVKDE